MEVSKVNVCARTYFSLADTLTTLLENLQEEDPIERSTRRQLAASRLIQQVSSTSLIFLFIYFLGRDDFFPVFLITCAAWLPQLSFGSSEDHWYEKM